MPMNCGRQWSYFFDTEMAWLDRNGIPLFHTPGNHTTYDIQSEAVYRDVMARLPQNGPSDQRALSYYVRRGNLLIVFVNTMWSGSGGEGTVETLWLEQVLSQQRDARHKLVIGHHPVWPVNGYYGDYQRHIERRTGRRFWELLSRHDVLAYICSHILAFDVQVHAGVLQLCAAGAGTAHRMPEKAEYLHIVQAALDDDGLRYQVLDRAGQVREWLDWNWQLPPSAAWEEFHPGSARTLPTDCLASADHGYLIAWEISGQIADDSRVPQMLLCANAAGGALPPLWLGIAGADNQLTVLLSPQANRSAHRWQGPSLPSAGPFRIQFAIHSGMGPGGLLWRWHDESPWSSMIGASAWGAERLPWSQDWRLGNGDGPPKFRGRALRLKWRHQTFTLSDYL